MSRATDLTATLDELVRNTPSTRLNRIVRSPIRTVWPVLARKFGFQRPEVCPTFFGADFHGVLPEAVTTQVWRNTYYCPEVCRATAYALKPGDHFVDIGSHFGFFSLLAATLVGPEGRTLSIEAMPSTFNMLERNMAGFVADGRSSLHRGAAFDKKTELEFKDFGIVASSLNTAFEKRGNLGASVPDLLVKVDAEPADAIIARHGLKPQLIKIDAESAERFVLRGLEQTIAEHRPALILEMGDAPNSTDPDSVFIHDFLRQYGYSPFSFRTGRKEPYHFGGRIEYENLLFISDSSHTK